MYSISYVTITYGLIKTKLQSIRYSISKHIDHIDNTIKWPDFNTWIKHLKNTPIVSDTINTPLVFDSYFCLYFSRYFDFQNRLINNISQRFFLINRSGADQIDSCTTTNKSIQNDSIDFDRSFFIKEAIVDEMLGKYLPGSDKHIISQKKAVKNSLMNNFTIISGGPGTGKTYIVSIIQKIILSYAKKYNLPEPEIICMAPTGKAASKMDGAKTIHSVLRPLKDKPGFYYNKNNPMLTDVVIIDEASMIDISLLTRLFEAIPLKAKVILLGDKHQLSSVQAGSVFTDICSVKNLDPNIFFLEYNFRSKGKTGIEKLSKAINSSDADNLENILTSNKYPDVEFEPLDDQGIPENFINKHIIDGYKAFLNADTIKDALDKIDNFKILCAHNSGEYGTLQINYFCEKILRAANNFNTGKKKFKKIVMVNTNDYKKGLFNGDTGIWFDNKGGKKAFFKTFDNNIKQYQTLDLPDNDTAFAITIHKSQGSEFKTVLIILPDRISPVITRQLLYTGVTRAQTKVIIIGNLKIIQKAIGLSVRHSSGLTDYLRNRLKINQNSDFID